jgi:NitT/TauT family transport system permease protein
VTATRRATDTLIVVLIMLAVWQALHQIAGETALPAPQPTLSYLVHNIATRRFAENAATTAGEFAYALVLAYAIGLAVGVWMGAHRLSGAVGEPILIALYSLPKIVLYPVVLLIFGLGFSGKVTFGAMHGILPVALLTMGAIRAIPPVYLRAARTLQLSPGTTIVITLLGVLLGEMFASKAGLGSMIMTDMQLLQGEEMMTVTIVLFGFAAIANAVLLWIEHRLHRRV